MKVGRKNLKWDVLLNGVEELMVGYVLMCVVGLWGGNIVEVENVVGENIFCLFFVKF